MLTDVQKEVEWRLCEKSAARFLNRWWSIPVVNEGVQMFTMYPYQEQVVGALDKGINKLLVLKGRQIGFTTLVVGYMTWLAMFHEASTILFVSRRDEDAKRVIKNLRQNGWKRLPQWIRDRCPTTSNKKDEMEFANGSTITAAPPSSEPARGYTASLIVLDEWAFFKDPESAWRSVQPAADVGGRIIAMSTANGAGTTFHRQWEAAQRDENGFTPMFFSWRARPDRDDEWYQKMRSQHLPSFMAQEYPDTPEEAFVMAGSPVFPPELVERQGSIRSGRRGFIEGGQFVDSWEPETPTSIPPIEMWHRPSPGIAYSMGVDPAGVQFDGDPTSIHVCDEDGRVVAHWCGNTGSQLAMEDLIRSLGHFYNDAFIVMEVGGGFGQPIINRLSETDYPNIYYEPRETPGLGVKNVPGKKQTTADKMELMRNLIVAMENMTLHLPCERTKKELSIYQDLGMGKFSAPSGSHDDRVISLALAVHGSLLIKGEPTPKSVTHMPTNTMSAYLARRAERRMHRGDGKTGVDILIHRHKRLGRS